MIFIMLFFEMASRLEETMVDMLTKARCHVMGIHSSPEKVDSGGILSDPSRGQDSSAVDQPRLPERRARWGPCALS